MNIIEKLLEIEAYRYARKQKFKQKLNKIKYGDVKKRKMEMSKKLTIFLLANFSIVELYTLYIMYVFQDISALPTLITVVIGEVIALMVYQIKALKENTSNTGFVYELKMKDAECKDTESTCNNNQNDGFVG